MADPHHADHDDYQRGTMEISEQVATWKLVQALFSWGSVALAAILAFLVIWFQPGGSFVGGAIVAFVMLVGGFFFLKSGKKH